LFAPDEQAGSLQPSDAGEQQTNVEAGETEPPASGESGEVPNEDPKT
jgi:hypothetical protein